VSWLAGLASAALTAGLTLALLRWTSLQQLKELVGHLSLPWLPPLALLYLVICLLRALRLRVLGVEAIPLHRLTAVTLVNAALIRLLPVKSGELSLPLLLRRAGGLRLGRGTAVLVIARGLDLGVVALAFGLGATLCGLLRPEVVSASALSLLGLYLVGCTGALGLGRLLNRMGLRVEGHRGLSALVCTILIWGCLFGFQFLCLRSVGLTMSLRHLILAGSAASLAFALPANGLGGFGAMEGGWAGALVLVGWPHDQALLSGVLVNLLNALICLSLGAVAAVLALPRRRA